MLLFDFIAGAELEVLRTAVWDRGLRQGLRGECFAWTGCVARTDTCTVLH